MAEEDDSHAPLAIPAPWPCKLAGTAPPGTSTSGSTTSEDGDAIDQRRGRYVVTTRAVVPGEAVLEDTPYAVVVADPLRSCACARCLRLCTERVYQCGGCRQTCYCSEDCVRLDAAAVHGKGECRALVGLAQLGVEGDSQPMRLALRMAVTWASSAPSSLSSSSPFHSAAFIRNGLEHHFDDASPAVRQGLLAVGQALAGILKKQAGVLVTGKELARALLAIQCNAHAVRSEEGGHVLGLGLFPLASMLNHSCRPTSHHVFRLAPGRPPVLVFKSLHALAAGQELAYSYTDLLRPGDVRRATLAAAYFFACGCGRCSGDGHGEDGRLIERALGSPACARTKGCPGVLAPVQMNGEEGNDKEEEERPWLCSACGEEEPAAAVESRLGMGAALLQAKLQQALDPEEEDDDEDEEEGPLSSALRGLADLLFASDGEEEDEDADIRLHPQHWLVSHALIALCQQLLLRQRQQPPLSKDVAWLHAAAEAWALQNLWLVATAMTAGPDGGGDSKPGGIGHFPELGQRLVAAASALRRAEEEGPGTTTEALLAGEMREATSDQQQQQQHGRWSLARLQASLRGNEGLARRLAPLWRLAKEGGHAGLAEEGRRLLRQAEGL